MAYAEKKNKFISFLNYLINHNHWILSAKLRLKFYPILFRFWFLIFLIMLPILITACRDPVLKSNWIATPIIIDGKDLEWKDIPFYKLDSRSDYLKLSNDAEFLYLLLSLDDSLLTRPIGSEGVKLEFTGRHGQELALGLQYSGINTFSRRMEANDSFWEYLSDVQKKKFNQQQKVLQEMITVIRNGQKIRVPPDGEQGLAAARIFGQRHTDYEFKIPFSTTGSHSFSIDADIGESIGVIIDLADQTRENFQGDPAGPASPRSGRWLDKPYIEKLEIKVQVILAKSK